jgi:hypothetical protein
MVVQAIEHKEEPIDYIQIPDKIPEEIIENDSFLTIESNMNKLEDKLVITARSVLSITSEMKFQLFEIERLEKTIIGMHDYMLRQNLKIEELQNQLTEFRSEFDEQNQESERGFWAKLFSRY